MELLQKIKNNSSTFHIRTKEEIDQLFNELSIQKLPIDNQLDFYIRMSIQKVKLQLYYELKLVEYRRTDNSATKVTSCEVNTEPLAKEIKKKAPKKEKKKRIKKTTLELENERRANKTKEELIAENRARVGSYHPNSDFKSSFTGIAQARKKIEEEKEMIKRMKRHRISIISIPMGGQNKKH